MTWRPHGHAAVDPYAPRAWATCDRCGFNYNHERLKWDRQWAGTQIINRRFLVCDGCLDIPQEQLRVITIPPDPIPIRNARPEPYEIDETNFFITEDGQFLISEDGLNFVTG